MKGFIMDYSNCKRCQHKEFDINKGIICGITQEKPSFTDECPSFKLAPSRDDTPGYQYNRAKNKNSINYKKVSIILVFIFIPLFFAYLGNKLENNLIEESWSEVRIQLIKDGVDSVNKSIRNDLGNQSLFNYRMKKFEQKIGYLTHKWQDENRTLLFIDKFYLTSILFFIVSLSGLIILYKKVKL
ncbi:hypothetical protein JW964_17975 [candidate division KSB1 bacterium]|nr:hypothetical protein [candidate division KSB1 bacterium]